MSHDELQTIQRFILQTVEARDAMKPSELIDLADEQDYSPSVINRAMWQLVGEGELGFTENWQLTAK
jgi:hypothetical protein